MLIILASCQTIMHDKTPDEVKLDILDERTKNADVAYDSAILPYQQGQYAQAITSLQSYLDKFPSSIKTVEVTLMVAESYFQLSQYPESIKWYERVIEFNKTSDSFSTAEALYKLGLIYEFTNQDTKAVATYLDALKRKSNLSFELTELEIPARLAMTYVRIGEFKSSKKYFLMAEKGIKKVKSKLAQYQSKSKWLAQVLFQMGFVSSTMNASRMKNSTDLKDTLFSIDHAQEYLLFSAELNDSKWSAAAADELFNIYNTFVNNMKTFEASNSTKDDVLNQRVTNQARRKLALQILDQIDNLKDKIIPDAENKYIRETMKKIVPLENELNQYIAMAPVNEGITEEAKKLDSLKREGH